MFGALILTHGRPEDQFTLRSLRSAGYTGPIKLVVDDEDPTLEQYYNLYGSDVVVFSKAEIAKTFDEADTTGDRRSIVYARNASWQIAKDLGWTHFIQLDDDYTYWTWLVDKKAGAEPGVKRLDNVFAAMVKFLDATPTATIAMTQGGDLLGGAVCRTVQTHNLGPSGKRKAMNTFVCRTDRPIQFLGRINEDVTAYTHLGSIGVLFFTQNLNKVNQRGTQGTAGGMTELYQASGTYVKSFYSVMFSPSSVKVKVMNSKHPRIHHQVSWRHAVPKIVRER